MIEIPYLMVRIQEIHPSEISPFALSKISKFLHSCRIAELCDEKIHMDKPLGPVALLLCDMDHWEATSVKRINKDEYHVQNSKL